MVYLKIISNTKYPIKIYHNHNIIYLNGKKYYQIKLDFDIDNLYVEINNKRLIFNTIKSNNRLIILAGLLNLSRIFLLLIRNEL